MNDRITDRYWKFMATSKSFEFKCKIANVQDFRSRSTLVLLNTEFYTQLGSHRFSCCFSANAMTGLKKGSSHWNRILYSAVLRLCCTISKWSGIRFCRDAITYCVEYVGDLLIKEGNIFKTIPFCFIPQKCKAMPIMLRQCWLSKNFVQKAWASIKSKKKSSERIKQQWTLTLIVV